MRIIKVKTLVDYCRKPEYKKAENAILVWISIVRYSEWDRPADVKIKYKNASILNSKRVVFNINGNRFRLIVDIEYKLNIVFIVWFGFSCNTVTFR